MIEVFCFLLLVSRKVGCFTTMEATSSRNEPSNFHKVYIVASMAPLHSASTVNQSLGTWHLQYFQKQTVCIPFLRLRMFMNVVILKLISIFISFPYTEREQQKTLKFDVMLYDPCCRGGWSSVCVVRD